MDKNKQKNKRTWSELSRDIFIPLIPPAVVASIVAPIAIVYNNKGGEVTKETWTITFNDCAPEGELTIDKVVVKNGNNLALHNAKRVEGYVFLGWKTVKNDGSESAKKAEYLQNATQPSADKTYYGWWEKVEDTESLISTTQGQSLLYASNGLVGLDWNYINGDATKIPKHLYVPSYYENPTNGEKIYVTGINDEGLSIGSSLDSKCHNAIESITLPDSIISIGASAFADNWKLKHLNMPQNLKILGNNCFINCYSLEEVILPEGIESIEAAFSGYYIQNMSTFVSSGSSYTYYFSYVKRIVLPSTLKSLIGYSFNYCLADTIDLSKTKIKSLPSYCFYECTAKEVKLPNTLESIGYCSFEFCPRLENISIPKNVKSIGYGAFVYCYTLTKVEFEKDSKLVYISDWAFGYCYCLTEINIPAFTKYIGYMAFSSCGLQRITFENADSTWYGANSVQWVPTSDPVDDAASVLTYTESSSINLKEKYDQQLKIGYITNGVDKAVVTAIEPVNGVATIPATLTDDEQVEYKVVGVDTYNFFNGDGSEFKSQLKELKFENDANTEKNYLEYISDSSFYRCNYLTKVNFADLKNLQYIDSYAFDYSFCVDSGSTVTTVDIDLSNCTSLTYIGESVFANNDSSLESVVGSVKLPYSIEEIDEGAFNGCVNMTSFTLCENDGQSNLQSIGSMFLYNTKVETLDLSKTKLTSLCTSAFDSYQSSSGCGILSSITLPETLTSIGSDAFNHCSSLTRITIPSKVTYIGSSAFFGSGLTWAEFADDISGWIIIGNQTYEYNDVSVPANNATALTTTYVGSTWQKKTVLIN